MRQTPPPCAKTFGPFWVGGFATFFENSVTPSTQIFPFGVKHKKFSGGGGRPPGLKGGEGRDGLDHPLRKTTAHLIPWSQVKISTKRKKKEAKLL